MKNTFGCCGGIPDFGLDRRDQREWNGSAIQLCRGCVRADHELYFQAAGQDAGRGQAGAQALGDLSFQKGKDRLIIDRIVKAEPSGAKGHCRQEPHVEVAEGAFVDDARQSDDFAYIYAAQLDG